MREHSQKRRIVVGVDGSPQSKQALRWALRQAELTGAVLEAIIAWEIPVEFGWAPVGVDSGDLEKASEQVLNEALDEVTGDRPPVTVYAYAMPGNAASVLLEAAKGADLLVLGSRGHGGFVGALLGSVSQSCLHHAPCPVAIIRGPNE